MYLRLSGALSVLALAATSALATNKIKTGVYVQNDKTNKDFVFDLQFEGFPEHGEATLSHNI